MFWVKKMREDAHGMKDHTPAVLAESVI